MEKKDIKLKDVENFMGIKAKDFVSENAKKLHPSFDGYDKLRLAATTASALHYGEPDHHRRHQDSTKKFFKRLEYKPGPEEYFNIDDSDYQEEEENIIKRRRVSGSNQPAAALSPELEKKIEESGADGEPVLVITKELTSTDVDPHQNRMLLPVNQFTTADADFLLEDEVEKLNRRGPDNKKEFMEVPIIMPSLEEGVILFRRWDMGKKTAQACSKHYVLNGKWTKLREREGIKAKMEVQLWAYRVNQKLRFALVNLTNPNPNPNPNGAAGGSSASTRSTRSARSTRANPNLNCINKHQLE